MTITSYKNQSKIATAIAFIAAFIVYIGKDELAKLLPQEYAYLAGIIVLIAGYIVAQKTENKRVNIAEKIIEEQYTPEDEPTNEIETPVDTDDI